MAKRSSEKDVHCMSTFQILIQTITFGNQFLFPLSEPVLFNLDLLGKSLPQVFFLFLEFGIVQFPQSGFPELPGLHLTSAVRLVVRLFRRMDKIQHMSADEDRSNFLKIAVILVLNLGHSPQVLSSFDDATVARLDIFLRPDDGEGHRSNQATGVLGSSFVIFLDRWLINFDSLSLDDSSDLYARNQASVRSWYQEWTYTMLESSQIHWAQRIGFGDNRNQVDSRTKSLHDFDI